MRCINYSYNNIARSVGLLDKIAIFVVQVNFHTSISVKGVTSTSYFSAHFKNTTFGVMERKFLCSGDVLDLADLADKAK